jgi:hypothetical protein
MAPTLTASSTEVAGLVDRVTFHNSESGFCVLRVKARGPRDPITLVGHAALISAGEFVQASESWVDDSTHQERHDLADDLLLGPAGDDPLRTLRA